jgi:hypothetical protein
MLTFLCEYTHELSIIGSHIVRTAHYANEVHPMLTTLAPNNCNMKMFLQPLCSVTTNYAYETGII